jgi:hypothetical protein
MRARFGMVLLVGAVFAAAAASAQDDQQVQQQALGQQRAQACAAAAAAGAGDPRNWYANMLAARWNCNLPQQQRPRSIYCTPTGGGSESCTEQ